MSEPNMIAPTRATTLPQDPKERKKYPVASGVLDYFPDALVAVARVSWQGNEQHNPGEPLHWARGKSMDQDDTLIRHFLERGGVDTDGQRHTAKLAWRALALLQLEIEADLIRGESAQKAPLSSPFDRAQVGDTLPFERGIPYCRRESSVSPHFSCTRERHHSGQHVAQFISGKVCGVWRDNA